MREVIVINPNAKPLHDKIRTAAYCRVSSDSDEQLASFSSQVSEYTNRISKNPDWVMVDIYADEGISGTSAAKRPEFQRLMADCRKKKIDRILTKSISRSARNVKECIAYIRELQSLGVSIEFEKEGIDTAFLSGEMMVAVFGSLAQEESASISANMRLSYKGRMERGEFITCCAPYGYRLNNGKMEIIPEQAEIVRWIFESYINGMSREKIANLLTKRGVKTSANGTIWYGAGIGYILSNEKYVGNSLSQKRFTQNGIWTKRIVNHGEQAQYFCKNSHPAIISEWVFEQAQRLVKRRTNDHGQPHVTYPLSKRIQCPYCGASFRRKSYANGVVRWSCYTHDRNSAKCSNPSIEESIIKDAFCQVFLQLKSQFILQSTAIQLRQLRNIMLAHEPSVTNRNREIASITAQLHMLSRLRSKDLIDDESFLSQANEMNRKLLTLREQRQIAIQEHQKDDVLEKTLEIIDILQDAPESIASLEDGGVFASIVDKVIIDKSKNITFRLINGLELGGVHG